MRKLLLIAFLSLIVLIPAKSQDWLESFEGLDSLSLPAGWSKWNEAPWTVDPLDNWTVRDSGSSLPGLSTATAKSHSGLKSIGVTWLTGVDDTGGLQIADAWLVTKRIHIWNSSALMSYWMACGGGSQNYRDSVQIWVSTVDSTPSSFTHYIETISGTGPYGTFLQNFVTFDAFVGQDVWVGFKYNQDVEVDGYFVNLDDVEVLNNPIGIQTISSETPIRYNLKQNYPNPFNPVTNIEFDIAKSGYVSLVIYNTVGQVVSTLVNQQLSPGTYKYDFNASGLPSGSYFYRLTAGDFVQTNKMILVK